MAAAVCIALIAVWGYRVYAVNSRYHLETKVYMPGECVDFGDYRITNLGGGIYTVSEFCEIYGKTLTQDSPYVICLKVKLEHNGQISEDTQEALEDVVNTITSTGFRTTTWYNGMDPFTFADLNFTEEFIREYQETGQGELLIVSNINPDTMQKDRYEHCRELSYDYVLDIYPVNIRLRVEKMGEN